MSREGSMNPAQSELDAECRRALHRALGYDTHALPPDCVGRGFCTDAAHREGYLLPMGVEYAPLPYALYRMEKDRRRRRMSTIRDEAERLLRELPGQASWDDLMYEIYVRQKIEEGLRAADEGRVLTHGEVKRRFAVAR
jgi:predicted transcriptional regulator